MGSELGGLFCDRLIEMRTNQHARRARARAARWITPEARGSKAGHSGWLIGAVLVGLLVSFVFADVLSVPRPWFVLAHTVISGMFLAGYATGWGSISSDSC